MWRQADPYGRGSYCIVVAIHGDDSEEAAALRDLRDNILQPLPFGPRLIRFYYGMSPSVTSFLSTHPLLQGVVGSIITGIARITPY